MEPIRRGIKNKIRYRPDTSRHVINLSKHSFLLDTFKLLNKKFLTTSKMFSKKKLDADAKNPFVS